jgi:microcystin-dependent protein
MPVPSTWDDIFPNPAQNSPQGSEPVGTLADDYIRQAFAFIKQLHDGWIAADGSNAWTGDQDAGGHQIKNVALATDPGDVVTRAYLNAQFPVGTIIMWHGLIANKPAGWVVCDGTNGTPNFINRMPWGAANDAQIALYGGANSLILSAAQMPIHNHGYNDYGHSHSVSDYGHVHPVNDYGHVHSFPAGVPGATPGNQLNLSGVPNSVALTQTNVAQSNIAIAVAQSNLAVNPAGIGIAIQNAGGNQAFDNRPAFCGTYFLMKV